MHSTSQRIQLPFLSHPTPAVGPSLQVQAPNKTMSTSLVGSMGSSSSILTHLMPISSLFGDWIKIAILGALVEFARRAFSIAWAALIGQFFITARFDDDSPSYDWLMVWLSKCNAWNGARDLQASSRESDCYLRTDGNVVMLPDGAGGRASHMDEKLVFLPKFGSTHTFVYNGYPMQVYREKTSDGWGHSKESITLSMFGRDRKALDQLLLDAQKLFKARQETSIVVWQPDMLNMWRRRGSRARRPMTSIILEPEIKDTLLNDARDFLRSGQWYADRGIPFRRGYLLHGAPGAGKTSLIHAIAGALNLDIYVVSLSKPGLNDTSLGALLGDLPTRSILLIEDIDAAFTHGISRDPPAMAPPGIPGFSSRGWGQDTGCGVTLSGLLNAVDGIYAQEGRILFATTNRYDVLDAALIRPGRLDMHFEFKLASQWQAREIFRCFYLAVEAGETPVDHAGVEKPSSSSTLTESERDALADDFAEAIPDGVLSMASLQGYLVRFKTQPHDAVDNARAFVETERLKRVAKTSDVRESGTGNKIVVAPKDF